MPKPEKVGRPKMAKGDAMSVKELSANLKAEKKAKERRTGRPSGVLPAPNSHPVAEYVSAKVEMHTAQKMDKPKSM